MKATLEFDDGFEFRCAVNGRRMLLVLWELDQEMRNAVKYRTNPCQDIAGQAVTEHWRSRLRDLCVENRVDLEDDYA
jgi:hypothetical protein